MVQDRAVLTVADWLEVIYDHLLKGAIFSDLEWLLTQDFKSMPLFNVEYLRNGIR